MLLLALSPIAGLLAAGVDVIVDAVGVSGQEDAVGDPFLRDSGAWARKASSVMPRR
jgi:hypothetical protein